MERLTREVTIMTRGKEAVACNYKNDDCNDYCRYGTCRWQEKANMLLKKYEDTGLAPEQIINLQEESRWIPVEERLPEISRTPEEDDECPEFNVTIMGAEKSTTLKYSPADSTWFDDNGFVYNVIAWRPLPDLYQPEIES